MAAPQISLASRAASASRKGVSAATLFALAILAPVAATAQTYASVDAGQMTCAALQDVVEKYGAVTVYSNERHPNFNLGERFFSRRSFENGRSIERFVAHRGFCFYNEVIGYQTVTTRDTERCSLKICAESPRSGRRR